MSFNVLEVGCCHGALGQASRMGFVVMKIFASRFINDPIFAEFLEDSSGATAIEYGLIAAGISVAIIAVVQGLGSKLNTTFTSVQNALN
jgi:pilus assembly protein Flp/PilA